MVGNCYRGGLCIPPSAVSTPGVTCSNAVSGAVCGANSSAVSRAVSCAIVAVLRALFLARFHLSVVSGSVSRVVSGIGSVSAPGAILGAAVNLLAEVPSDI